MSILQGSLADEVTAALIAADVPLGGILRRVVPGGVDEYGDPLPGHTDDYPFQGWRESYAADFAAAAGIPQTDARLIVLATTISTAPVQGDTLQLEGTWWMVRAIEAIDPASTTISLQVYAVGAP